MKNLVSITFIALFILFTACSKDDDGPSPKPPKEQLALSASVSEAEVDEPITFEVTANGTTVTDALLEVLPEKVVALAFGQEILHRKYPE